MTRDSKETMRHGERRKFTQTTRSLPARAAGARMRLVFALISVITLLATMFVTGPFQARVAVANALANAGFGSLHRPSSGHISDNEGADNGDDRGVATWVGGNMWIGAPKDGAQQYSRVSGEQPKATYAVEAEGLTLVQGKLAMNMVKGQWREAPGQTFADSWHRQGFRFGIVGFGGQIRPKSHSTVLSVNGGAVNEAYGSNTITLYDGMNTDCMPNKNCEYKGQASDGQLVNVYGYGDTGRGFLDYYQPRSSNLQRYYADIRGSFSEPINNNGEKYENGQPTGKRNDMYTVNYSANRDTNAVIYAQNAPAFNSDAPNSTGKLTNVNWNRQNNTSLYPGTASLFSKVFHNDAYLDFSNFQEGTLEKTSNDLIGLSNTGITDIDTNKNVQTGYVRQKYNYNSGDEHKYKLTMNFNDQYKEKIIKFTGDGVDNGQSTTGIGRKYKDGSHTQVFTLDGSELNSAGYNGISFEFDRIPEGAAVVVNVVGSAPIEFHNGWRFWWNGEDISNYYVQGDGQGDRNALYSRASEAIMWNFANTSRLTVRGGIVSQGQAKWESPNWSNDGDYGLKSVDEKNWAHVEDDPGAAMIGSIMVPRGTFESHVSTNGRVWVGGDFMMYNPDGLTNYAYRDVGDGKGSGHYKDISASLICMDQERHNFIWTADYTDEAAPISWNKVNSEGERIGGTKWGVYNSLAAAQRKETQQAPINAPHDSATKDKLVTTVTDDGSGDWDPVAGTLRTGGLTKNADYYIRELEAAPGHQLNDRIYRIDTTQAANNTTIVGVWEKKDGAWQTVLSPGNTMEEDLGKYMLKDITPSSTSDTASRVLGIINSEYPSVEWEKVDSETGEPLGGSEWQIWHTPAGDNQVTQVIAKDPNALTDSVSTRIYFSPGTANWDKNSAYISYLDNDQWKDVPFNADGLRKPNGMRVATVPMKGASFTFKIWHGVNGIREYYPNAQNGTEFQAPANEGHYVVASSTKQQAEIPACSMEYASKHDSDPREGRFKLIGLGQGEYMIHEHKVPAGHWDQVNGEKDHHLKFGFKVAGQNVNWVDTQFPHVSQQPGGSFETKPSDRVLPSSVKDGVGVIGNAPTEVSWWKIDADDKDSNGNVKNTVLAGSEWQLQKWDDTANPKAYVNLGDTITDSATTTVYFASAVSDVSNLDLKYGFKQDLSDLKTVTVSDSSSCNGLKMATIPSEGEQFWLKVGGTTLEIAAGKSVVLVSTNEANNPVVASQIPACAVSGVQDLNPEPGKFTLKRLPVGKYRLKETKAPLGYVLPADEYIYFEVTAKASGTNDVQWKQGWSEVTGTGDPANLSEGDKAPIAVNKVSGFEPARAVGNNRKPGSLKYEKVDSDDPHNRLTGSEWKLTFTPRGGGAPSTIAITDCTETYGTTNMCHPDSQDRNKAYGAFEIKNLEWGEYSLVETKAPDGYNLDDTEHKFTIGPQNLQPMKKADNSTEDSETSAQYVPATEIEKPSVVATIIGDLSDTPSTYYADDQGRRVTVPLIIDTQGSQYSPVILANLGKIGNEPGVVLPVTGAEGRHLWPAIVGALFVLVAFGCAVALRMRE